MAWFVAGEPVVMSDPKSQLSEAPEAVFRLWHFREQIEVEAAQIFGFLAERIAALYSPNDPIAVLCLKAQEDELRHRALCRAILGYSNQYYPPVFSAPTVILGPQYLSNEDRILYTAVAIGCVTETLSTALLIEMRKRAEPGVVKNTIHSILTDEITHARIGWAEISRVVKRQKKITWLNEHIPHMIQAALASDIAPMIDATGEEVDLSTFGILTRREAKTIMQNAIQTILEPGLKNYGLL
jgi:hypothetical protein